jgi:hypothetical protein
MSRRASTVHPWRENRRAPRGRRRRPLQEWETQLLADVTRQLETTRAEEQEDW